MIKKLGEFGKNLFKGILIGVANIVPGVSAGTMFVLLGIFKKFIDELHKTVDIFKDGIKTKKISGIFSAIIEILKNQKLFLIPIGIGLVVGVIALSKIFSGLDKEGLILRNFVFLGLIIGGLPALIKELSRYKEIEKEKGNKNVKYTSRIIKAIYLLIGIMIMGTIFILKNNNIQISNVDPASIDIYMTPLILIIGMIGAISMVIPGISGSLVILILGFYEAMTKSISSLNMMFIIPFAIGVLLGIIVAIKVIKWLLDNYYEKAYSVIIGIVIGSLIIVYPGMPSTNANMMYAFILFVAGAIFGYSLERMFKSDREEK